MEKNTVTLENTEGYKLAKLDIQFMDWGEYRGKYVGKVTFVNGKNNAFTFTIPPERMTQYLALIADELVVSAASLGQQLLDSFKLLPSKEGEIIKIESTAK